MIEKWGIAAAILQLPLWMIIVSMAVLGAIWGSFTAALCQRWPKGESVVRGRSRCDSCGATLQASELVPLLSYSVQLGRCRRCGEQIGSDAFVIELLGAGIGLAAAILFDGTGTVSFALFGWSLLPLFFLDLRHFWLPDSLIFTSALLGALCGEALVGFSMVDRIIGALVGFGLFAAIRWGYLKLHGFDGMGGGDPKLVGALGLWLGWQALPMTTMIAAAMGLMHHALRTRRHRDTELRFPLGSYLIVGAALWLAGKALIEF